MGRVDVRTEGGAPQAPGGWLIACVEMADKNRSRNAVKGARGIGRTLNGDGRSVPHPEQDARVLF